MDKKYCVKIDDGVKEYLEIVSFVSCQQYSPYSLRAICVDAQGNISAPSIEQIRIISAETYLEMIDDQ